MCEGPEPQRCLGRVQPGFCPPHTLVKDMKAIHKWPWRYGTCAMAQAKNRWRALSWDFG